MNDSGDHSQRRGRLGRAAMWAGLAVCVLLFIVGVAGVWWHASWISRQRDLDVSVGHGQIAVLWVRGGGIFFPVNAGWRVHRVRSYRIEWWPEIQINRVAIPLWIPLVVVAIPTGFLWRRERGSAHASASANPAATTSPATSAGFVPSAGRGCERCGDAGELGGLRSGWRCCFAV